MIPLPVGRARARRVSWFPVILLSFYVSQCLWFAGTQSLTYDEPIHFLTGVNAWHGNFNVWNDHPPLARMLFGLPLMTAHFQMRYDGISPGAIQVHAMTPAPQRAAWLTRPLNVCLGVLLGLLLWCEARRRWSEAGANFALALFVLSPGMIAHFSVATTDGAGILAVFAVAVAVARWRGKQTWKNTIVTGVVCALALLAKFYTLPMVVIALAIVLASRGGRFAWRPRDWQWRHGLVILAIVVVVLWAAYGFHMTKLRVKQGVMTAFIPGRETAIVFPFDSPVDFTVWVPAGEYGDGLRYVRAHNFFGHQNYLFRKVSREGWWYYYPIVVLLKWPLIILGMGIAGVAVSNRMGWQTRETAVITIFPIAFAIVALFSHIQIGDRHFLPVYPFLLLISGGLWHEVRLRPFWRLLVLALIAVQCLLTLRTAPDYLSYFNFMPAENAWRRVSDSNLDWGQGLIGLRKWQEKNPGPLHLAYFGSIDPQLYGVTAQPLAPGERASGAVAVSMSNLSGQYLKDQNAYHWLLMYPHTVVDRSILVFEVKDK